MKLDIVTFSILCFHFEILYGNQYCSSNLSCTDPCKDKDNLSISHAQPIDAFPRESFVFNCSLPSTVKGFHMKLFKGQNKKELVCSLYIDSGKNHSWSKNEFCDPVRSGDEVSFVLRNLKSNHSDTYICCLLTLSPVFSCCKASEKHLYIQEESYFLSEKPCFLSELTSWILVGLTVLSVVACILCLIACCLRNAVCQQISGSRDYNNEYMSMAAVKPN